MLGLVAAPTRQSMSKFIRPSHDASCGSQQPSLHSIVLWEGGLPFENVGIAERDSVDG